MPWLCRHYATVHSRAITLVDFSSGILAWGAAGVVVSCKIPILVTRVRFPVGAIVLFATFFMRLADASLWKSIFRLCKVSTFSQNFNLSLHMYHQHARIMSSTAFAIYFMVSSVAKEMYYTLIAYLQGTAFCMKNVWWWSAAKLVSFIALDSESEGGWRVICLKLHEKKERRMEPLYCSSHLWLAT